MSFIFVQDLPAYSLKKYESKRSVLLVFAKDVKDLQFRKQLQMWRPKISELRKKEIALFYVFESGKGRADKEILRETDAIDLRKTFKVKPGAFRVVFVDKQGKTKRESSEPIEAEKLSQFIL